MAESDSCEVMKINVFDIVSSTQTFDIVASTQTFDFVTHFKCVCVCYG